MEKLINKVYTDPSNPGGFGGAERLYKEVKKLNNKVSRDDIGKFLEKNRTYTLFRNRRVNFKHSPIIPTGFLSDVHVDLGDFQSLANDNKGFRYLLVCVDTLSRRVFTSPVKSKNFTDIKDAFDKVFAEMPYLPQQVFSDRGKEFVSANISQYFKELGVPKFKAEASNIKAAFAERMIRTIKHKLYPYFSEKNTTDWVTVIPKITDAINKSICRSTGMRPIDINEKNADEVWERLYAPMVRGEPGTSRKSLKFAKGDHVRMSRTKPVFEKGYLPNFSDEILRVTGTSKHDPEFYELHDEENEPIRGRFYKEELVKTTKDTSYRIEKVLQKKTVNGRKKLLVKFIGYKNPEWIFENDLV